VRTAVVYVHGLWLTGLEGRLLRRRLARELKADTYGFTYRSVRESVSANAAGLARFLSNISADHLHVIAHSLGGLVTLKAFETSDEAAWPPGRLVLLGSPLQGSLTAQRVAALPFGRRILGRGVCEELLVAPERRWSGSRELGVIGGDLSVGLGRLVGSHDAPSDGTVFLSETAVQGANDRMVLRVSHTGLPFSSEVARQAAAFMRSGRFTR
jgi:pimeloyl-ACP methyl ester carboxylesterase